jgi:hypothetical protein
MLLPSAPELTKVKDQPAELDAAGKVITSASVATMKVLPLSSPSKVVEAVNVSIDPEPIAIGPLKCVAAMIVSSLGLSQLQK